MRTDDLIAAYFLNCKQNFCLLLKKEVTTEERGRNGSGGPRKTQ